MQIDVKANKITLNTKHSINDGVSQIWPAGSTATSSVDFNLHSNLLELRCHTSRREISILVWIAPLGTYTATASDSSRAHCEELIADGVKSGQTSHQINELTYPRCTAPANSPHRTRQCWVPERQADERQNSANDRLQIQFVLCAGNLTFEIKGMCILVYGFISLISTWVLMFLRSSAAATTTTSTTTWSGLAEGDASFRWMDGLKSRSPLTFYVLPNEGVIHYVTVIRFQDFLKLGNIIVLVSTGREKKKQAMLKRHKRGVTRGVTHPWKQHVTIWILNIVPEPRVTISAYTTDKTGV